MQLIDVHSSGRLRSFLCAFSRATPYHGVAVLGGARLLGTITPWGNKGYEFHSRILIVKIWASSHLLHSFNFFNYIIRAIHRDQYSST